MKLLWRRNYIGAIHRLGSLDCPRNESEEAAERRVDVRLAGPRAGFGQSVRGGWSTAQAASAPKGWSMKKYQLPSAPLRCTSMP